MAIDGPVRADGSPRDSTTCGILVATSGVDVAGGGLSNTTPVQTINFAISRAQAAGLNCIFVRAGTYTERVALAHGIAIVGGYDANWTYGSYTIPGHATIIAAPASSAPFASVTANSVAGSPTSISNVIIIGQSPAESPRHLHPQSSMMATMAPPASTARWQPSRAAAALHPRHRQPAILPPARRRPASPTSSRRAATAWWTSTTS